MTLLSCNTSLCRKKFSAPFSVAARGAFAWFRASCGGLAAQFGASFRGSYIPDSGGRRLPLRPDGDTVAMTGYEVTSAALAVAMGCATMVEAFRTALVTGGARRIGKAIVEDLAAHGFAVAIHCNGSLAEADRLAGEIAGRGGRAVVLRADLTDFAAADRLVSQAADAVGPLGLLVNNASIFTEDAVIDFEEALLDRHFAIHVKAPAVLARRFAASLPDGTEGLIVNMIDQRVWRPTPRYFSYTLSKAALWTATRTMAMALAPRIRVNAIGPGPTVANARQNEVDFAAQIEGLMLKRGPALAEFGSTIRYLWEARSVTGQMIALDGGQHLAWQTPDVTGMVE